MKRLLAKGGAKGDLTPYQPDQRDSSDSQQGGYPSPQQSHRIPLGDSGNQGYIPRQTARRSYQMPTAPSQPLHGSMQSTYPAYEEEEPQQYHYGSQTFQHGRRASQGREALPESRSQQAMTGAPGYHRPGFPPSLGSSYDGRAEGQIPRETPHKKEGGLFKGLRRHQKTSSRATSHMEELSMQRSYSNSPENSQFFTSEAQHMRSHGPSRSGSSGSKEEAAISRHGTAVYESYGASNGEALRSSLSLNRGEVDRQPEAKKPGVNRMWAGLAARGRAIETMLHQEDKSGDTSRNGSPQGAARNEAGPQKVIPLGPQKKDKWFDLKGRGGSVVKGKTHEEGEVTAKIGWLCSDRASTSDWSHILSFADTLAISEEAAREASQALRREFKLGEPESQKRAVKVWALLFINSSDLFRTQIVKKSFLEILEQTVIDPKTSLKVKERLLDAWAMLAYQYQGVPQLSALTKSYNRVCPSDRAMNGEPLDLEHEIFSVPSVDVDVRSARQSQQYQGSAPYQPAQQQIQQPLFDESQNALGDSNYQQEAAAQNRDEPDASEDSDDGDDPDTIMLLFEASEVARMDASLLIDSLTSAGLHSPEVQELVQRCRHSLELLNSQMEWTNLQVARAHFRLAEERLLKEAQGTADRSNGSSEGKEVVQERLLASMEEARGMLTGSLGLVEETEREEREEEEERRVTELSKLDFRIDRSTLHQDPNTGELLSVDNAPGRLYVPVQSGSSAPASRETSPLQPIRPLPPILASSTATPRLEERSADLSVSGAEVARRLSSQSASSAVRIDRPSMPSSVPSHPALLPSQRLPVNLPVSPSFPPQGGDADLQRSFSLNDHTAAPARPSAKALGKRRATSRDDTDVPVEQLTSQTDGMQLDTSSGGAGAGAGSRSGLGLEPVARTEAGAHAASARLSVPPQPSSTTVAAATVATTMFHSPSNGALVPPGRVSPALPPLPTPAPPAAPASAPPSLPPVPAAYRVEQQQQRERRAPPLPLPTPGAQAQAGGVLPVPGPGPGPGAGAMPLQSNNPYATAAAAAAFMPSGIGRVASRGDEAQAKPKPKPAPSNSSGYTSPPLPPHPTRTAGAMGAGQRNGQWR